VNLHGGNNHPGGSQRCAAQKSSIIQEGKKTETNRPQDEDRGKRSSSKALSQQDLKKQTLLGRIQSHVPENEGKQLLSTIPGRERRVGTGKSGKEKMGRPP